MLFALNKYHKNNFWKTRMPARNNSSNKIRNSEAVFPNAKKKLQEFSYIKYSHNPQMCQFVWFAFMDRAIL